MLLEDFLKTNPTPEKVAEIICKTCNYDQISIVEMESIEILCDKFNLNINNFYEDSSDYEKYYIGVYHWKYRNEVSIND